MKEEEILRGIVYSVVFQSEITINNYRACVFKM